MIENKTLLITGGTGSWGQKATEILLTMNPHSIRIFSRGEYLQSEMAKRFKDERLRFCIGDVRDKDRLLRAMDGCDYVIHAAALKQVPACEYNPLEAIRTNVDGAMNVIDAAIDCQVEKVMAISTDKACVDYFGRVELADGKHVAIRDLVMNRQQALVKSLDAGRFVDSRIVGWYKNKKNGRGMVHLSYQGAHAKNGKPCGAWFTDDHPILTPSGWRRAGEMVNGDEIVTSEAYPNALQSSLLCGIMLGDGSIPSMGKRGARGYMKVSHAIDQAEWVRIQYCALKGLGLNPISVDNYEIKDNRQKQMHFSTKATAFWADWRTLWYDQNRRVAPREFIESRFSVPMLAAWYLDDGCVDRSKGNSLARLATHDHGRDDVLWLAQLLTLKGYECQAKEHRQDGKSYWMIRFTAQGSRRLYEAIGPYVPTSMRHKVPDWSSPYDATVWNLGEATPYVGKALVSRGKGRQRDVYCLDIEGTHNFAVGGVIAHNCGPVNLYGATKMVMEKLMVQANVYGGMFSCVRYGNVLGSRGSVVPLFREQAKTGKVTITHPDMTRFWITLEQGVRFVLDCMERQMGAEIFVPKIPSMKITEIASYLAPGCEQVVTGIRPGEKLHECLVTPDECAEDQGDRYVIYHEGTYGGLCYTSDKNPDWLDETRLAALL